MTSADKRSVATDALDTLGMLIDDKQARDAIHLAVEPVMAGETLRPGDDVGFLSDGSVGYVDEPIGIVDPFLKALRIKKGERFWLVVYPRQITSLRHVWTHPAFPDKNVVEVKLTMDAKAALRGVRKRVLFAETPEQWLTSFAERYDLTLPELLEAADDYVKYGQEFTDDRVAGASVPQEFWPHFEALTGVEVAEHDRHDFFAEESFSCGC